MMTTILVIMISEGTVARQPGRRIARRKAVPKKFLFEVQLIDAGLRLNRSHTSRSDPFGRVPAEPFWNSFRRDVTIARLQSVPAILPRRASTGPRFSGDIRSEPQPRAEICRMTSLFL